MKGKIMNSIQNYDMQQNIAFQGVKLDKAKTIAKNQAYHLFLQGGVLGTFEAIHPSTNILQFIVRKIGLDLGELLGHKINSYQATKKGIKSEAFSINKHGLNIFAYINALKNQVKKIF
jgi:hypothetical protein